MPYAAEPTVTYQPPSARGMTIGVAAVAAVALIVTALDDVGAALRHLPVFLVLPAAVWAFYGRPAVIVSDGGVTLRNVLRSVELPWPAILRIDTKYALTLETAYGPYNAWAAPVPSRTGASHATRRLMSHQPESAYAAGGLRPGDLEGTPSGDVAAYIRRRWEALRDAGHLDDPRLERARPVVRWHPWPVLLVVALVAACAVALA